MAEKGPGCRAASEEIIEGGSWKPTRTSRNCIQNRPIALSKRPDGRRAPVIPRRPTGAGSPRGPHPGLPLAESGGRLHERSNPLFALAGERRRRSPIAMIKSPAMTPFDGEKPPGLALSSGPSGLSTRTPSGVISSAQANMSAIGKPRPTSTHTIGPNHPGRSKVPPAMSASSTTTNPAAR